MHHSEDKSRQVLKTSYLKEKNIYENFLLYFQFRVLFAQKKPEKS